MFRILIVEDIESTLEQLHGLLAETFPGSQIDRAQTVKEGRALIEAAYHGEAPYHAVILDFKLPLDVGENPEADESLCELARRRMRYALIAHISAYTSDGEVQDHLRKVHVETVGDRAFALSKANSIWPEELLKKMKSYLYSTHILHRLQLLFGTAGAMAEADYELGARVRGADGHRTHELSDLSYQIEAHWYDLDESARQQIQEVFRVEIIDGQVRAGLL